MDREVLKEMEKALGENKTLETLRLHDDIECHGEATLRKEFCRHLVYGIQLNTSLSGVDLDFQPINCYCPSVGRLVYVSRMLCYSVGCSV